MSTYKKPYLTFQQQLDLLRARGLIVTDEAAAIDYLERIGYYRLSAYWYPLRRLTLVQDKVTGVISSRREDAFVDGARFQDVVDLYVFDKKLRLLLADALERIEVAVRVDVAYLIGQRNPFAHTVPDLLHGNFAKRADPATGRTRHKDWMIKHDELVRRSKEDFVRHYQARYGQPFPIWVAIELWDFGMLSVFYNGMAFADKDTIARQYGVADGQLMSSWLRTLNYIRNLVAHHSRLWNRDIVDQPRMPRRGQMATFDHLVGKPDLVSRVYAPLCIVLHLLNQVCPKSKWPKRLDELLKGLPNVAKLGLGDMGFPDDWERQDIWREALR